MSSSVSSHCVITYVHPVVDASVKRQAHLLRSRKADVMVSSSHRLMVSQACWCSADHPACCNDILRAAARFLRRLPLSAVVISRLSLDEASENSDWSRRIHPVAALNCHTSPRFCGGDTLRRAVRRSGSAVTPSRVILSPQDTVSVQNRSSFPGCIARWCSDTVLRNLSLIHI